MQRMLLCVLGVCCATGSQAQLIRTDAYAQWHDEHIVVSSRLATAHPPQQGLPMAETAPRLLHVQPVLSAATLFDTNSSRLRHTASLTPLIASLAALPATRITVTGHTDNTGNRRHNQTLSMQRAFSVIEALRKSAPQHQYIAQGLGETQPVASNLTRTGRDQNRRVEVSGVSGGQHG